MLFRTARDRCISGEIPAFKIRLYNMSGVRGYELPTADLLGGIVFEDGPSTRVLPRIKLKPRDSGGKGQKVTMNAYYRYQLHPHVKEWQAFPIICGHGLYDTVSRGDHEGIAAGSKIILSRTFTGGPQYMYSHYQDALAICRSLGNPQFFITLTCNVKWPEIKRYMAQYPDLTPADRANVICRVFEQKVKDFHSFLKEVKTFGDGSVEFQKRGLPHCHALLWVDSKNEMQDAQQTNNYISSKIPDSAQDPRGYKLVTEVMMHGPCGAVSSIAVCNGEIGEPDAENEQDSSWVTVPPEYTVTVDEAGMSELIDFLFDDTILKAPTTGSLWEKEIVCPKNAIADVVNAKILSSIEGQSKTQFRTMTAATIASLIIGQENCILEAKVYRIWISKSVPDMKALAYCCIMIDREIQRKIQLQPATSNCQVPLPRPRGRKNKKQTNFAYTVRTKPNNIQVSKKTEIGNTRRATSVAKLQPNRMAHTSVKIMESKIQLLTGEKITGHPCSQVAQKYTETDEQRFPTEIVNTIGKKYIFQIRYAPSTQRGAGAFIADDVLDIQLAIQTKDAGTAVATSSATPSKGTAGKEKHITSTNCHPSRNTTTE
nr:DNA helicase [Tanacetum cinerariifolium]